MSSPSMEKELMHRFQKGDAVAFNTIYNRYYSLLRDFSFRLICQKQEAEDIVIETFVKLFRLYGNFESVANIRAFLYVTARNACYDYLFYTHRRPAQEKEFAGTLRQQGHYPGKGEPETEGMLQAVLEAIENLPEESCRIFKMIYLQGLKTTAIAQLLHVSEQSVRQHKRHSIQLLRIALFERRLPAAALIFPQLLPAPPGKAFQGV
jgi:RNA polymerase sigma factor (sigma-70 family)